MVAAWNPAVSGGHLWLDKAAPKEFAGEVGEFTAELNVGAPVDPAAMEQLFKHETQARQAELWLQDEGCTVDPVRDTLALRAALLSKKPVSTERCPRCFHH